MVIIPLKLLIACHHLLKILSLQLNNIKNEILNEEKRYQNITC